MGTKLGRGPFSMPCLYWLVNGCLLPLLKFDVLPTSPIRARLYGDILYHSANVFHPPRHVNVHSTLPQRTPVGYRRRRRRQRLHYSVTLRFTYVSESSVFFLSILQLNRILEILEIKKLNCFDFPTNYIVTTSCTISFPFQPIHHRWFTFQLCYAAAVTMQ